MVGAHQMEGKGGAHSKHSKQHMSKQSLKAQAMMQDDEQSPAQLEQRVHTN